MTITAEARAIQRAKGPVVVNISSR